MPKVQITLKDGSSKTLEFQNGFTDDDIDEAVNYYNSQINQSQQEKPFNPLTATHEERNEHRKQVSQKKLDERKEWETKHPFISGIQKDYQPGYRASVPEWEMSAKYGIDAPLKEQVITQAKTMGLNLVPAVNIAVDIATGGNGAAAKAGLKELLKQGAKTGAKTGLIGGATQGVTSSLADNGVSMDLLKRPLMYGGTGLVFGAPLGAGGALIGNVVGNIAKKGKNAKNVELKTDAKIVEPEVQQSEKITKKGLENQAKEIQKGIADSKVDVTPKTTVTMSKQGHFWSRNIDDPMTKSIRGAEEELNSIIGEIQKNPEIVKDPIKFEALKDRLSSKLGIAEEVDQEFYSRFYEAATKADEAVDTLALAGEYTQRGLPNTVINAKGTPKEVKKILKQDFPEYKILHNNELTDQAVKEIEKDFNNELSRLTSAKDFEALDYEKSRQIAKRLFDMGRHEEAINLIDNVSENATKKGQAIQALSLWSNMTPEGAVFKAEKLITEYNKKVPARKQVKLTDEQIEKIRELQNAALNATDDVSKAQGLARTAKYVSELVPANIGQKLKAYRNISLLLNPKTLERNIIGNTLFNAVDTVSKAVAVPVDRTIGFFTGNKTRVVPQLKEFVQGGIKGAKTGFQEALEGIDTRGLGQRFDLQSRRTFKNPIMRGLETALDVGLRVPDRIQYEATFAESVANMMKAQGLTEPTQEILEQAEREALESVFQNNSLLSDITLGTRNKVLNAIGIKDFGLGDASIAYAQTPANLVQQAINYSPAGFIKGGTSLLQGNQRQASLDLARALMGTGIIGGGVGLAKAGLTTPTQFDENYNKNRTIKANLKPLGISTGQIGDVWYEPFQPMSTTMAISDAVSRNEDPIQAGLNTMLDLPFMQNVNRFISDVRQKGTVEAGKNFISSVPSQFVPTALGQVAQTIDPYQRETYDPNILRQGLNQAIAKVPGASRLLPEKIDVTGKPIERYESKGAKRLFDIFLNPTYVTHKKDDVTLSELKRLYDETGDTEQFLPIVSKNVSYKNLKGEDVKIKLTGAQFSNYQKQVGTINKEILDNLVSSDFYKNLEDEEKIKLISTVTSNVKSSIDTKLFNKPDVAKRNLIKRLTESEKDKIIKDVLKMYKNDILPSQIENSYKQNFD